jgi:hypothetical protein
MYVWFFEPEVGVVVGREEVDVLLLYLRVEVAFVKGTKVENEGNEVVLYFPVADVVGEVPER